MRAGIRGLGDAYAFRRLLWLVLLTVVLPTLLLSAYGVYAVRNQRIALRQRLGAEYTRVLAGIAVDLLDHLESLDRSVRDAAAGCAPPCAPEVSGAEVTTWTSGRPPVGLTVPPSGPETVWTDTPEGPLAVFSLGDMGVAWRPDLLALQDRVAARAPHDAVVTLSRIRRGTRTPAEVLEPWRSGTHDATLPLDGPLSGWRLTLDSREASSLLGRTSTVYVVGLVILVVTVLVGVAVTLRSTARELRLSRLQTDFVSRVSHELRTPLTSIRMFVEMLRSGRLQDPERVAEALDLLGQETDRLSRRIERVLNWARMEAGRRVYEVERVSPRAVVDDALSALRTQHLLDRAPIPVEVDVPDGLPDLLADRDALAEAILNLVQNALRHAEGATAIRISATAVGNRVGLSVHDDGPGIPRRHRKRIFEKFYQADPLLSADTHGSGLGLAIVRAVAHGHGGRVTLETEEGQGSTFTLWIPVAPP